MKLDGFGIMVDDMAVMVRFYRDVLGFEIKEEEDTSNVFLEKDVTAAAWGQRTCYIADPEGNLVEIGSFNKE